MTFVGSTVYDDDAVQHHDGPDVIVRVDMAAVVKSHGRTNPVSRLVRVGRLRLLHHGNLTGGAAVNATIYPADIRGLVTACLTSVAGLASH